MSNQSVTISFYLPVQILLLVLFYGGIMPTLPIWLVFLPTILLGCLFVFAIIVIILAAIWSK